MPGFERKVMKNYVSTQVVSNTTGLRDTGSELLSKAKMTSVSSLLPDQTPKHLYAVVWDVSGHPLISSVTIFIHANH